MKFSRILVFRLVIVSSVLMLGLFIANLIWVIQYGGELYFNVSDLIQGIFTLFLVYYAYNQTQYMGKQYQYQLEISKPALYARVPYDQTALILHNAGNTSAWIEELTLTNLDNGDEDKPNFLREIFPKRDVRIWIPREWNDRPLKVKLMIIYYITQSKMYSPQHYSEVFTLKEFPKE